MPPPHRLITAAAALLAASCLAPLASASTGAGEHSTRMYTTAYTWFDNTPRGSSILSNPVVHDKTGGTGTYGDPVTVAVGHSMATGEDVLDYPAGTRMYVPSLRKYLVVEDTCGDGDTPQNRPCHIGYRDDDGKHYPWIDVWIDGANTAEKAANACASKMTDVHTVVLNPRANYAVTPGSVMGSGCRTYSDEVLTQDAAVTTGAFAAALHQIKTDLRAVGLN